MKRVMLGLTAPPSIVVPPAAVFNPAVTAWPTANKAILLRFTASMTTPIRYISWAVGTQSGNVQAGIVRLSGTSRLTYSAPVASTGVIACPASGNIRSDLGVQNLTPGDYAAFLWADNTTFTTRYGANANPSILRSAMTVSGLSSGLTTSGTAVLDTVTVTMALEADV